MTPVSADQPQSVVPRRSPWRDARPQNVFAVVTLIFGTALALLTPPFQVPDEAAHFLRVYQLSQGVLLSPKQGDQYGGQVPLSMARFWNEFEFLKFHPLSKTSFGQVRAEMGRPLNPRETVFMPFPNTALYSPAPYLPQIIGTLAASRLVRSPISLLWAGRLGSVAGYVIIGWLAILATPVLKWPTALVLIGPMALFLAASESADQLTIAIAFLAVALVLRIALAPQPPGWPLTVALGVAMVAMTLCKSAYVPLVALLLAVPPGQWTRRPGAGRGMQWAPPLIITAFCLVALFGWSALTHPMSVRERAGDPMVQVHWVEHNPITYARVLLHTTAERGWNIFFSGIGVLGWVDTTLSTYGLEIYVLAGIWMVLNYDAPLSIPVRLRVAAGVSVLASLVLVATGIYIIWDPAGTPTVEGMQGRYLLPLALPLFILFQRRGRYPAVGGWMAIGMTVVAGYTVIAVVQRYYLPG
jgi:uncharacterized membrane protein